MDVVTTVAVVQQHGRNVGQEHEVDEVGDRVGNIGEVEQLLEQVLQARSEGRGREMVWWCGGSRTWC